MHVYIEKNVQRMQIDTLSIAHATYIIRLFKLKNNEDDKKLYIKAGVEVEINITIVPQKWKNEVSDRFDR